MAGIALDGLQKSLARKIATFKIPDARIDEIAKSIFVADVREARLDVCAYGICIDYLFDRPRLDALAKIPGLRRLELFPWGIPVPDVFHAHLEVEVPELTGGMRG